MKSPRIIIIGGGFAGRSAAEAVRRSGCRCDLVLIDKSDCGVFLPMLPDTIGRGIKARCLKYPLAGFCEGLSARFVNAEVTGVDPDGRAVTASGRNFEYDYLLIASGSRTNFYGNGAVMANSLKLDDAADAESIIASLNKNPRNAYIVAGAGYTGVEVASNLRRFLSRKRIPAAVIVVEKSGDILGPLPSWIKEYVRDNLEGQGIEILAGTGIASVSAHTVVLDSGRKFEDSMLIWTAGVKTADFVQNLNFEKNAQGRLKVDGFMRLNGNCFAAGDAAYFQSATGYLRMAVQFSIAQGYRAGSNIARVVSGKHLINYKPLDLGFIIPMANDRSCGIILGGRYFGRFPTLMHYTMCLYRMPGLKNKARIALHLLKRRFE